MVIVKLAVVLGFFVALSQSVPMHIVNSYESSENNNESNLDAHESDVCSQICMECLSDHNEPFILVRN